MVNWAVSELLGVMSMDLNYFEQTAPVIKNIVNIITALGWALLLGNLIYQAIRSMMHGIGFESEDPKILFCRTFVFAFLLAVSRQICGASLAVAGQVIEWLGFPTEIKIVIPPESSYAGANIGWLVANFVGWIFMFQIVKLLFEIGERYIITCILTYFAPLAFGLGGSKHTNDVFKAWCRMYASMLVMMIMNMVFLKLIISAMTTSMNGNALIWAVFVIALTKTARKIDSYIARLGMNPAITGDGGSFRIPGILTTVALRSMLSSLRGYTGAESMVKTPQGSATANNIAPNSFSRTGRTASTNGGVQPPTLSKSSAFDITSNTAETQNPKDIQSIYHSEKDGKDMRHTNHKTVPAREKPVSHSERADRTPVPFDKAPPTLGAIKSVTNTVKEPNRQETDKPDFSKTDRLEKNTEQSKGPMLSRTQQHNFNSAHSLTQTVKGQDGKAESSHTLPVSPQQQSHVFSDTNVSRNISEMRQGGSPSAAPNTRSSQINTSVMKTTERTQKRTTLTQSENSIVPNPKTFSRRSDTSTSAPPVSKPKKPLRPGGDKK